MVVFATAHGVPELMIGRVVQGLSTGAALGAVGAGMLDIDKRRGTVANSFAPGLGTASGSLISTFLVQYLPAPTHLVYLALVAVFALQAVGVFLMKETLTPTPGALATLVPDVKLPRTVRRAVLNAAPVLIAVWALAGFYGSLGPALVRTMTHSTSAVYGGLALFVLAGVAAAATLVLRTAPPRGVMLTGIGTLVIGVALTLLSIETRSTALFFTGTAIMRHRLRQRLPGRHPHSDAADRGPRAVRSAVPAVRRVLPGHGPARGHRRVPGRPHAAACSPRHASTGRRSSSSPCWRWPDC